MKVLVVGSGGREHAIARALARSPRCERVVVAPGNAGTPDRVEVAADDPAALLAVCREHAVDLVVVGPEAALAAGVSDVLRGAGLAVFGPSRAAARLETSKAHARAVAARLGIPGPRHAVFVEPEQAVAHVRTCGHEVVVKASGLAAGKGVVVPASPAEALDAVHDLLARFGEIVVEERLTGDEVSLLGFCDGRTVAVMPPAQDHKRIGEGDRGPNTGGMGAFAPAALPAGFDAERLADVFLRPVVEAQLAEGEPYVGVLYAGLMLTADGPRLLEWNCRFGDPETQALLPLLDTDLLDVVEACVEGRLHEVTPEWRTATACTVVMAAPGYPGRPAVGSPISGPLDDPLVFHAGTALDASGAVVTSGGRVLAVTGVGADLLAAREQAYARVATIAFAGAQVRRDIGWRAVARSSGGYAASGVDIDAGTEAVERMKAAIEATHGPAVLRGIGSFGGVFDLRAFAGLDDPVLVASTDGVGTKVTLALAAGRPEVVGTDIVHHCVDDVLVQGARPAFFLDYVAAARLDPVVVATIVNAMAAACGAVGCALLGGETAEMPGVYHEGHLDVAGTLVGVAERSRLLPRDDLGPGDVLVGLASSGPHTNGYSLLRRVFAALPLDAMPEPLDVPLGDALLAPHRNYLPVLAPLLGTGLVKALVHVTGGGLPDNLPRVLPPGVGATVRLGSWPVPPLFRLVAEVSGLDTHELHRTLNMGIGMVVVCAAGDVAAVQHHLDEPSWVIGSLAPGEGVTLA